MDIFHGSVSNKINGLARYSDSLLGRCGVVLRWRFFQQVVDEGRVDFHDQDLPVVVQPRGGCVVPVRANVFSLCLAGIGETWRVVGDVPDVLAHPALSSLVCRGD